MTETQPGGSPTVLRMILARQLQALREKAGMSYEQAAQAIYSSEWTIRRMERAEGGLKPLTVILRSSVRTPRAYTYRAHTRTDDHLTQPGERLMVTMSNRARCPPGRPGTARPAAGTPGWPAPSRVRCWPPLPMTSWATANTVMNFRSSLRESQRARQKDTRASLSCSFRWSHVTVTGQVRLVLQ